MSPKTGGLNQVALLIEADPFALYPNTIDDFSFGRCTCRTQRVILCLADAQILIALLGLASLIALAGSQFVAEFFPLFVGQEVVAHRRLCCGDGRLRIASGKGAGCGSGHTVNGLAILV